MPDPGAQGGGYGKMIGAAGGSAVGAPLAILITGLATYALPGLFPVDGSMAESLHDLVQALVTLAGVYYTPHNFGGG